MLWCSDYECAAIRWQTIHAGVALRLILLNGALAPSALSGRFVIM